MTKSYFQKVFKYDSTVNKQLFDHLKELNIKDDYILNVFSHLVTSENLWIRRIKGEDVSNKAIWPILKMDEILSLIHANEEFYKSFLNNLNEEELERNVVYKNSKGIEFSTPVIDILTHVMIHGGYHRGQIASAIRRGGNGPINTDYITYIRNQK